MNEFFCIILNSLMNRKPTLSAPFTKMMGIHQDHVSKDLNKTVNTNSAKHGGPVGMTGNDGSLI